MLVIVGVGSEATKGKTVNVAIGGCATVEATVKVGALEEIGDGLLASDGAGVGV